MGYEIMNNRQENANLSDGYKSGEGLIISEHSFRGEWIMGAFSI